MLLLPYRLGKPGILYIISDVILDYKKAGLSLGRSSGRLWGAELSLGRQGSLGCEAGLLFQDCVSLIRLLPGSLPWAKCAKYHSLSGYLTKVNVFTGFFFLVYLIFLLISGIPCSQIRKCCIQHHRVGIRQGPAPGEHWIWQEFPLTLLPLQLCILSAVQASDSGDFQSYC